MNIFIRHEKVEDYHQIAKITAEAFTNDHFIGEVSLIDSLRRAVRYDRELSLVAIYNDEVVGHVLFYPTTSMLNQKEVPSVLLGPICVKPKYQKMGVGGNLIEEGHKRAKAKGYKFSYLWGHSSYYPKFGYISNMFGETLVKVKRNKLIKTTKKVEEKRITKEYIKEFIKMWDIWFSNVDMSIRPENSILEWLNNYSDIEASAIFIDYKLSGYIRYNKNDITKIKMLLAYDKESTLEILNYVHEISNHNEPIEFPLDEDSYAREFINELDYEFKLNIYDTCMINILDEEFDDMTKYCNDVLISERKAGQAILPPYYEME